MTTNLVFLLYAHSPANGLATRLVGCAVLGAKDSAFVEFEQDAFANTFWSELTDYPGITRTVVRHALDRANGITFAIEQIDVSDEPGTAREVAKRVRDVMAKASV